MGGKAIMIDARFQNESKRSPPRAVAHSIADLAHDATVLVELQSKLFKAELDRAGERIVAPIVMLALAGVLALASVPLLLVCFAYVLVEFAELTYSLSFLLAAVLGMVLAGGLGAAGYFGLKKLGWPFPQSQVELRRNLDWFRGSMRPTASAETRPM
jgi:hypothetical protein